MSLTRWGCTLTNRTGKQQLFYQGTFLVILVIPTYDNTSTLVQGGIVLLDAKSHSCSECINMTDFDITYTYTRHGAILNTQHWAARACTASWIWCAE